MSSLPDKKNYYGPSVWDLAALVMLMWLGMGICTTVIVAAIRGW